MIPGFEANFLNIAVVLGYIILSASVILVLIRLIRGPSLSDRVVALDLLAAISVAYIGLYAVSAQSFVFLDAAIAVALIMFLGTISFARFLEWDREKNHG